MPTDTAARLTTVLTLREIDGLTFAWIAHRLGVSRSRAASLYHQAVRHAWRAAQPAESIWHLSARGRNGLLNAGFAEDATAAEVAPHLERLRRGVAWQNEASIRNFGRRSLIEVEDWLRRFGASPR